MPLVTFPSPAGTAQPVAQSLRRFLRSGSARGADDGETAAAILHPARLQGELPAPLVNGGAQTSNPLFYTTRLNKPTKRVCLKLSLFWTWIDEVYCLYTFYIQQFFCVYVCVLYYD